MTQIAQEMDTLRLFLSHTYTHPFTITIKQKIQKDMDEMVW